jgi:hypothetical protein
MEVQDGKAGFEPGKKAIFVRDMNGHNLGKIVRLLNPFEAMDAAEPGTYVPDPFRDQLWIKGEKCHRTWMVESLGEPIVYIQNGELVRYMEGPVPEYYLAPLDDFEQDDELWVSTSTEAPALEKV